MATSFDSIIDVALVTMNDYKLDRLYEDDKESFKEILSGYIVSGTPMFQNCLKPLTYDLVMREFDADLDMYEINILASLTIISWYEGELQNVLVYNEPLRDVDFNKYSTGQNIRPRQDYIAQLRSDVKMDINNYQLMHLGELPYWKDIN